MADGDAVGAGATPGHGVVARGQEPMAEGPAERMARRGRKSDGGQGDGGQGDGRQGDGRPDDTAMTDGTMADGGDDVGAGVTRGTAAEVFAVFLRLGLTSFGGPVAHLGYFREELVVRRRWLDDRAYGDLVALCQFLPGPASSQVGFALGLMRAGWAGGLAAFAGFTLPSALAMVAFALSAAALDGPVAAGALHGLKVVAVAIVAQAVLGMAQSLCPDRARAAIAAGAVAVLAALPGAWGMPGAIALGALAGLALGRSEGPAGASPPVPSPMPLSLPAPLPMSVPAPSPVSMPSPMPMPVPITRRAGLVALALFAALSVALPLLSGQGRLLAVVDSFHRAGSLVFGGGHVVLPLLEAEVLRPGWVAPDAFLAGYGAAQALPGPLFTFAAYLGALIAPHGPVVGALAALLALFLPGALLLIAVLPFWDRFRRLGPAQALMRGANAAVVGILGAALYDPVFTSAIGGPADFALALACFVALVGWQAAPWRVVLAAGLAGVALHLLA